MLPYSAACDRNQGPILEVLQQWLLQPGVVLEIGSGTGQHAVHFAQHLPQVTWQPTDCAENVATIQARIRQASLGNLHEPLELDVLNLPWAVRSARYVFSANTAHIMSWSAVEAMFAGIETVLPTGGHLLIYGPFNRDGEFTSESNLRFDQMLRVRDPNSGIRDDVAMMALAERHGLSFAAEYSMPAENRMLVWTRA
jgi:cyclopropane fatty-acyl-phospholipid synthase-like methyltransferase